MQARVERWGDDLAIRLPQELADKAGIVEGQEVEVVFDGNRTDVRTRTSHLSLEELLNAVTPDNRHNEVDFGSVP